MTAEEIKEREELGQVPNGLFAKWTTDRKAFDEAFLDVHLDDDALRHFVFHLATLSEIARELDPTSDFGDEQLVLDDERYVGTFRKNIQEGMGEESCRRDSPRRETESQFGSQEGTARVAASCTVF